MHKDPGVLTGQAQKCEMTQRRMAKGVKSTVVQEPKIKRSMTGYSRAKAMKFLEPPQPSKTEPAILADVRLTAISLCLKLHPVGAKALNRDQVGGLGKSPRAIVHPLNETSSC